MLDAYVVGAAYRTALTREMRTHAALGIPWQVSDGERSFPVRLPGIPRMDTGPVVPWVSSPEASPPRPTWTAAMTVAWAREALGFSVASALGTTVATVQRWTRGATSPRGRYRLRVDALQEFRALLASAFATPERALLWLRTPPRLGCDTSPLTMVRTGAIRPLVELLDSLESGAFT